MLPRPFDRQRLNDALAAMPVVLLVGPRQCGKSTMARALVDVGSVNYFDLENPLDLARLSEPMTTLSGLRGLVVIDEIQLRPDLFGILRVLVDREPRRVTFLVLGSAQPAALRQVSESLTGRVRVVELGGLLAGDTGTGDLDQLWLRGGFPRAYLADDDAFAAMWLGDYARTIVERDLPAFDIRLPSTALRRFLSMVCHASGQTWNSADPARSLGISEHTVRRYLDVLTDALLVRQLQPWFSNVSKRQVRSPKVFVRDTGLTHHLLGISTEEQLLRHPKSGATWEGLVIEQLLRILAPPEAYFWATHGGAELDLFLPVAGKRVGVEVKRADAPVVTASIRSALSTLELDHCVVLYPGTRAYQLGEHVRVEPVQILRDPHALREALGF